MVEIRQEKSGFAIGDHVTGSTAGSVLYVGTDKKVAEDNDGLYFDGSFGIGTAAPGSFVHIEGATNGDGGDFDGGESLLYLKQNTSWGGNQPWALFVDGYSYLNGFRINGDDGARALFKAQSGGVLGFATKGDDPITFTQSESTEVMRIASGGDVGINQNTPGAKLDVNGDARVGDSSTNYVEIEADGDVNFVGGAGLQYGQISADTKTDAITTVSSFTWYQITTFDTNGPSNGSCTPDHTNDHITIGKDGDYEITVAITAYGPAANHTWYVQANLNNNATKLPITRIRMITNTSQDKITYSSSGFASLTANDTVEVWVYRTSAGSNIDFTVTECVLNVKQIGG
jgi:hypothetical protein